MNSKEENGPPTHLVPKKWVLTEFQEKNGPPTHLIPNKWVLTEFEGRKWTSYPFWYPKMGTRWMVLI